MTGFDFDTLTDRRGTHSSQWDNMEPFYGVSPKDGLAMWTADSDYGTAPCIREVVRAAFTGIQGRDGRQQALGIRRAAQQVSGLLVGRKVLQRHQHGRRLALVAGDHHRFMVSVHSLNGRSKVLAEVAVGGCAH